VRSSSPRLVSLLFLPFPYSIQFDLCLHLVADERTTKRQTNPITSQSLLERLIGEGDRSQSATVPELYEVLLRTCWSPSKPTISRISQANGDSTRGQEKNS